jgi:hypothetical protein
VRLAVRVQLGEDPSLVVLHGTGGDLQRGRDLAERVARADEVQDAQLAVGHQGAAPANRVLAWPAADRRPDRGEQCREPTRVRDQPGHARQLQPLGDIRVWPVVEPDQMQPLVPHPKLGDHPGGVALVRVDLEEDGVGIAEFNQPREFAVERGRAHDAKIGLPIYLGGHCLAEHPIPDVNGNASNAIHRHPM